MYLKIKTKYVVMHENTDKLYQTTLYEWECFYLKGYLRYLYGNIKYYICG
jgi:hypothetical protein